MSDRSYRIDRRAYEGDVASRLRHWRGLHLAHSGELFEEAANEIARLRGDAQVARLRLEAAQGENATLTKRERKAVEFAAGHFGAFKNQAATLRSLLERLHT